MTVRVKILLVLLIFVSQVKAAGDSVTHVFSAGDTIKATEVNANFQELADRINALATANGLAQTYSYADYTTATSITTKKFQISNDGMGSHDTETMDYTRNGSETIVLRKRLSGGESGTLTQCVRLTYERSTQGVDFKKWDSLTDECTTLAATYTLTEGIRVLDGNMVKGIPFGGGFETVITAGDATNTRWGNDISTVLGTEDVTLTVNGTSTTYPNCLKVYRDRLFASWGDAYRRTSWFCEGMGVVKMIETRLRASSGIHSRKRELYATN